MDSERALGFIQSASFSLLTSRGAHLRTRCVQRQARNSTGRCVRPRFVAVTNNPSKPVESQTRQSSALLLVDHGSKRASANEMLSRVADMIREKSDIPVYTAHMEIASPTIADGMEQCVQNGAEHVIVVPFFLSPGRHATTDVPNLAAEAAAQNRNVSFEVRSPIGTHPGIVDVILDRAGLL